MRQKKGICLCGKFVRGLWQDVVIRAEMMVCRSFDAAPGLDLVALLLSCPLWNITLSEKSRQADMLVTIRQQLAASGADVFRDEA